MALSAFKRCGNGFRCSSRKPLGQVLYEQMRDSDGGVYGTEGSFEGPVVARRFALAMTVARARTTLQRAENQADPTKVYDLLTSMERHYRLSPGPDDSLVTRRAALAAAMLLGNGPSRGNVELQLRTLLGVDFVAWWTFSPFTDPNHPVTSAYTDPSYPSDYYNVGIFNNPALWKAITITDRIDFLGSQTVSFTHDYGDDGKLLVNDLLVVAPGELGQQEKITVTARTNTTLTAVFTRPHEAGASAIRQPWPFWLSLQKHSLVVVKNGRAQDRALRQRVDRLLHKLLSGVSTWDIVEENSTAGAAGPFLPGVGQPGITPINTASY